MVSAAGLVLLGPGGGFVGIGAAGSNAKSTLSAGHDGPAGGLDVRGRVLGRRLSTACSRGQLWPGRHESALLPNQLELGHVGQLNRVRSQLSDYLAAPYADHPRAGMEPPSSFGAGHAVDVDAP
jgi:hypothetical protein